MPCLFVYVSLSDAKKIYKGLSKEVRKQRNVPTKLILVRIDAIDTIRNKPRCFLIDMRVSTRVIVIKFSVLLGRTGIVILGVRKLAMSCYEKFDMKCPTKYKITMYHA